MSATSATPPAAAPPASSPAPFAHSAKYYYAIAQILLGSGLALTSIIYFRRGAPLLKTFVPMAAISVVLIASGSLLLICQQSSAEGLYDTVIPPFRRARFNKAGGGETYFAPYRQGKYRDLQPNFSNAG